MQRNLSPPHASQYTQAGRRLRPPGQHRRVGEQDRPAALDVLVEVDHAVRGVCGEILWRGGVQSASLPPRRVEAQRDAESDMMLRLQGAAVL